MKLRRLKKEDAPLMLEWMHDDSVVHDLKADFLSKTIDDCIAFIISAQDDKENLHLAITDDHDQYMGTVSLKHIRKDSAEFAITIRQIAMGKGYSSFAMREIIKYGFEQLNLNYIFWCVTPENKRAVRFYEKNGYKKNNPPDEVQGYTEEEITRYYWFTVDQSLLKIL